MLTKTMVLPGGSIAGAHNEHIVSLPVVKETRLEVAIAAMLAKVGTLCVCAYQSLTVHKFTKPLSYRRNKEQLDVTLPSSLRMANIGRCTYMSDGLIFHVVSEAAVQIQGIRMGHRLLVVAVGRDNVGCGIECDILTSLLEVISRCLPKKSSRSKRGGE